VGQNIGLREIMNLLFKHKYLIVGIFLLLAVATYVTARWSPVKYSSKAVIMVNAGREFVPIPEVGDMRLPGPSQEAIINTEMELIMGRDLSALVVHSVGADKLFPELAGKTLDRADYESAAQRFGSALEVRNIGKSSLIEIYYKHDDPQVSTRALSVLVEKLKERHLQVFSKTNSPFLQEQLQAYETRLVDSQRRLAAFREAHRLPAEDEGGLLLRQRTELDIQSVQEQSKLGELQQRMAFLKARPAVLFVSGSDLRTQLNTLKRKEQEQAQKFNDGSDQMIALRADIQLVEKQLKEQVDNEKAAERIKIESEIKLTEMRVASLRQQLQQADGKIQAFVRNTAHLQELGREVAANDSNYQIYLKKAEEARISENMDQKKMTNITVVQQPSIPVTPDAEERNRIMQMGLLIAVCLSFGTAFVVEFVPQTFTTPETVRRRLGVPVLATLAHREGQG